MANFVRVGDQTDFVEGRGRAVDVAGKRVAVFRVGGSWYAIQDACPHMGASLADGRVRDGRVTCTWHDRSFDLATGASDKRSGGCARAFEITTDGDDVLVRPADPAPAPADDDDWVAFDPERHLRKE